MLKRFFHAMDTRNEIFHSLLFPDLALKKSLELNVAELWTELDSDLNIEDRVLVYFCLLPFKFFILCCSILYHLQGKGFWTKNRFAHGDLCCGGNSSSFYPNRVGCFPPAALSPLRGGGLPLHIDAGKAFSSARMHKIEYLVESQELPFRQLDMSTPACHCIPLDDLVICYLVSLVSFCTNNLHIPSIRIFSFKTWFIFSVILDNVIHGSNEGFFFCTK